MAQALLPSPWSTTLDASQGQGYSLDPFPCIIISNKEWKLSCNNLVLCDPGLSDIEPWAGTYSLLFKERLRIFGLYPFIGSASGPLFYLKILEIIGQILMDDDNLNLPPWLLCDGLKLFGRHHRDPKLWTMWRVSATAQVDPNSQEWELKWRITIRETLMIRYFLLSAINVEFYNRFFFGLYYCTEKSCNPKKC